MYCSCIKLYMKYYTLLIVHEVHEVLHELVNVFFMHEVMHKFMIINVPLLESVTGVACLVAAIGSFPTVLLSCLLMLLLNSLT